MTPEPDLPTALFALEIPFPFIDPRLLPLPGPFELRWYGLGYLFGFVCAYFALNWLARRGFVRLDKDAIGDLIGFLVLGVVVGGRIGYLLFYSFDAFVRDPLMIIRIWEGGLSFHGGLLGVLITAIWFAHRQGITFRRLADALVVSAPFGIFAVRIANFINGELFGRVADSDVPWAIRFPTDPVALRLMELERLPRRAREEAILAAQDSGLWAAIRDQVPLRHPSQIYEALGEGLLMGVVLWTVLLLSRRRGGWPPQGFLAGLFLAGYGGFRSIIELFRQPDAQFRDPGDPLGTVLGPLTMGQVLSLLMVLGGLGLMVWAWRTRHGTKEAAAR